MVEFCVDDKTCFEKDFDNVGVKFSNAGKACPSIGSVQEVSQLPVVIRLNLRK